MEWSGYELHAKIHHGALAHAMQQAEWIGGIDTDRTSRVKNKAQQARSHLQIEEKLKHCKILARTKESRELSKWVFKKEE